MKYKLEDICFYVNEKIEVNKITKKNYISTENMVPDKGGITVSAALPKTKMIKLYKKHDILVSNIRPYFKKIWFADSDGGCSSDVLVFRAKEGINPKYLYYIISNDEFFDYSMATSKGTKMPRGDKNAIMKYNIPINDLTSQDNIVKSLSCIDDKIALNNRINKNLIV